VAVVVERVVHLVV